MKLIQKTARKVSEKTNQRQSLEIREEITALMNELVDLEFKDDDEDLSNPKLMHLPGEEDYLSVLKFSTPQFYLPNKNQETARYLKTLEDELTRELLKSQNYHDNRSAKTFVAIPQKPENNCNCLNDFYNQHSTCS